jgi:hypothetical protein
MTDNLDEEPVAFLEKNIWLGNWPRAEGYSGAMKKIPNEKIKNVISYCHNEVGLG